MNITKNGYSLNLRPLVELVSRLNGAGGHEAVHIRGMFFRVQDFETSSNRLLRQLYKEGFAAVKYLDRSHDPYERLGFSVKMKDEGVRLHMHTSTGFDTYDLSPILRHFLNDTCRVLEPMVKLLAQKYPSVSPKLSKDKLLSFNQYIKKLEMRGINTGVNNAYFYALYDELWNDYKHAESRGIHAGGWHMNEEGIIEGPRLNGERLEFFQGFTVERFIDVTFDQLNKVLDVTD